jgi:hypothetical protein
VRKKRGGKPESLLRDSDWEPLDGWFCRVTTLTPFPPSKGHPYASLEVEAPPLSEPTTGFVTHQLDFEHLLEAFSRGESEPDTEVQIVWTKQRYKPGVKLSARTMPRMAVRLCRKNAYELIHDEAYKPELQGPERSRASMPIAEWIPDVME